MHGVSRPLSRTSLRNTQPLPNKYHYSRKTQLAPLNEEFYKTLDEKPAEKNTQVLPLLQVLPKNQNNKTALLPQRPEGATHKVPPFMRYSSLAPLQNKLKDELPEYIPKKVENTFLGLKKEEDMSIAVTTDGIRVIHSISMMRAQIPPTQIPSNNRNDPPCGIALSAFRNYDEKFTIEQTPKLPSISDPNFSSILAKKLDFCSLILNFEDPNTVEAIDLKSRYLCEILQFIESIVESRKASIDDQKAIFQMLKKNIFDQVPVFPDVRVSINYKTVVIDPSWKHLFYCYQLLNRYIQIYQESELINLELVKKAIKLMSIPDNNERLQLLAFVRSYYDLHVNDRSEILKEVGYVLSDFMEKLLPPYAVSVLIVLTSHIFMRNGKRLSDELSVFIKRYIFPLITSEHVPIYIQHLHQFFTSLFVDGSPIIVDFYDYLRNHWYSTNPSVMTVHIELLIFVFPKLPEDLLKRSRKTFLSMLSEQLSSLHPKVVTAALSLWLRPKLDNWIEDSPKYPIQYMYDNVKRNSELYWLQSTREKCLNTLSEMGKLDRNIFLKMRNEKGTTDLRRKRFDVEHKAMKSWANVVKCVDHSVFDVKAVLLDIKNTFDFRAQEAREASRFPKPSK